MFKIKYRFKLTYYLEYVIDFLTEEPLLTDVLYLTRNHPFNEALWTSVISLMALINTTHNGRSFVSSKIVTNELNGCQLLLGESSKVAKEARSLLNESHKKLGYSREQTMLNPVIPLKHSLLVNEIEVKNEITENWYMKYYGKEIDLISFLLHGLLLPSVSDYSNHFFSVLFTLLEPKSTSYLMNFIDMSGIIPCVSHALLRFINDGDLIQQGITLLSLFSTCRTYFKFMIRSHVPLIFLLRRYNLFTHRGCYNVSSFSFLLIAYPRYLNHAFSTT